MSLFEYIKRNPKLSKLFTTDGLVLVFFVATALFAEYGELLPASISASLGVIFKVYNIVITSGLLETREKIIYDETGHTVNEIIDVKKTEELLNNIEGGY